MNCLIHGVWDGFVYLDSGITFGIICKEFYIGESIINFVHPRWPYCFSAGWQIQVGRHYPNQYPFPTRWWHLNNNSKSGICVKVSRSSPFKVFCVHGPYNSYVIVITKPRIIWGSKWLCIKRLLLTYTKSAQSSAKFFSWEFNTKY